jgi:hypothetical protein
MKLPSNTDCLPCLISKRGCFQTRYPSSRAETIPSTSSYLRLKWIDSGRLRDFVKCNPLPRQPASRLSGPTNPHPRRAKASSLCFAQNTTSETSKFLLPPLQLSYLSVPTSFYPCVRKCIHCYSQVSIARKYRNHLFVVILPGKLNICVLNTNEVKT